ncbi:Succinate--CoA ligase [ADP-forming] subunit alpha [Geodia barretti]|uniref:Succinate--CoA ligase [ADP-forming] subunit alpha n=1 Tax=Geodia barretti TaxID=519541 RepID=A0AA35RQK2_GEOBA|nr:Succinate--CoA ligase [ADP-forming] subunit alpha [Geodia barretti]
MTQGITGATGQFHTKACKEYGTRMVAGVTPGKGGTSFEDIPVFDSVEKRCGRPRPTPASSTCRRPLPPTPSWNRRTRACLWSSAITEGVPVQDMMRVKRYLKERGTVLVGPNCPGVITPGECKIGIMPGHIHKRGTIGVISRSGTLTYEAVDQLTRLGMGQSTCVGIGGDPIRGLNFVDVLDRFNDDDETEAVVLIGEIGGSAEQDAADWIRAHMKKPVVGFIVGQTAPPGKRMGHAGAIISGGKGTAAEKVEALRGAGVHMAPSPADIGQTMKEALG